MSLSDLRADMTIRLSTCLVSVSYTHLLPIIMYNVPSRTGCNILPQTAARLGRDFENIVGIKEASGNISQVAKLKELAGDDLDIYSGNDDQVIPILSLGGIGVISVLSLSLIHILSSDMDNLGRSVNANMDNLGSSVSGQIGNLGQSLGRCV